MRKTLSVHRISDDISGRKPGPSWRSPVEYVCRLLTPAPIFSMTVYVVRGSFTPICPILEWSCSSEWTSSRCSASSCSWIIQRFFSCLYVLFGLSASIIGLSDKSQLNQVVLTTISCTVAILESMSAKSSSTFCWPVQSSC